MGISNTFPDTYFAGFLFSFVRSFFRSFVRSFVRPGSVNPIGLSDGLGASLLGAVFFSLSVNPIGLSDGLWSFAPRGRFFSLSVNPIGLSDGLGASLLGDIFFPIGQPYRPSAKISTVGENLGRRRNLGGWRKSRASPSRLRARKSTPSPD